MADNELTGWAARAREGDAAAFDKVVRATARMVYAQVVASVRDRQKAEDLTQETFVAAWKGIGSLQKAEGTVAWLLTLARNKVIDSLKHEHRKKRGGAGVGDAGAAAGSETGGQGDKETRRQGDMRIVRYGDGVGVEEVADGGASPDREAEMAEAREQAVRVLGELPEEYRQVLGMRYLGGADYETIRGALGMSDGAMRGVLNRGMALLRERMTGGRVKAEG